MFPGELTPETFYEYLRDGRLVVRCVLRDTPGESELYFARVDIISGWTKTNPGIWLRYFDRPHDQGRFQPDLQVQLIHETDNIWMKVQSSWLPYWFYEADAQVVFVCRSTRCEKVPMTWPLMLQQLGTIRGLLTCPPHQFNRTETGLVYDTFFRQFEGLLNNLRTQWHALV
ncbi:MAG: hypothetical protein WCV50_02350 [Patescibacteria group bacterium]|jgi:hypothetical protein